MVLYNPITDHGQLDELDQDHHTQYLLVNGTRAMTADLGWDADGKGLEDAGGTNRIKVNQTSPHVEVTGDLEVSGHAAFVNASISAGKALYVHETWSDTSGAVYAVQSYAQLDTAGGAAAYGYGGYGQIPSGTAGNFTSNIYGIGGVAVHKGSGTLARAIGAMGRTCKSGPGIISLSYALWARAATNSGTITTNVGLKVDNQTVGVTNWGMQAGSAQSYHVGNLRVGSTVAPEKTVDITGEIRASDDIETLDELVCRVLKTNTVYTDATRPTPAAAGYGAVIWNSDDKGLNISDGAVWREPEGGWVAT